MGVGAGSVRVCFNNVLVHTMVTPQTVGSKPRCLRIARQCDVEADSLTGEV